MKRVLSIVIPLLLFAASVSAQNPTKWSLESPDNGTSVKAGETANVVLKAAVEPG